VPALYKVDGLWISSRDVELFVLEVIASSVMSIEKEAA
jgi:hypothetical protein